MIKPGENKKVRVYPRFNPRLSASIFIGVLISVILASILLWLSVSAQQNISPRLSVSPHTFDLGVLPGEVIADKIKLTNKSDVALPILVRTTDFTASDEIGGMSFDELSQDISFASRKWIKIENPNFILEPGETEKVNFTISVPENAEPGGHYAVMLFEPKLPSFYFKEDQPRAIPVIGVLLLFSVKTFTLEPPEYQTLEIVEFSVPKEERIAIMEASLSVVQRTYQRLSASIIGQVQAAQPFQIEITKKAPSSFILRIKNNDIYHLKPFGKVLIYNIFGRKVGEAEVPQRTILPGKIRQFPIEFSPQASLYLKWLPESIANFLTENFFFGRYQARLSLEAKSPLTAEILQPNIPFVLTFFSFPWQFWLIFILTFGLLIFLTIKYRKRITLAFKTLTKSG